MKRLLTLAITVLALAAVPVAFGDDGTSTPADTSAPAATQNQDPATQNQDPATQAQGRRGNRLELLRLRIQLVERRFAKHCGPSANGAPERCLDFAKKAEERLTKLGANIRARIAKIQQTCSAATTDAKCTHAADRVARLQKADEHVQALAQKVQDWLDGKTVTTSTSGDGESSLDQAAAQLGQTAGANG
jgi:hypothetical protein